jgi:ATP-dependent DNA ligase
LTAEVTTREAAVMSRATIKAHSEEGLPWYLQKSQWCVEPSFVADVEYRDITSEGLLRQSSFKGLFRK